MKQFRVLIDSASWECASNLSTCLKIYKYLLKNNHEIIDDPHRADFILINTCGVFEKSEIFSIDLYNKYYKLKKHETRIIMIGCLVKINKKILEPLDTYNIALDELDKLDNFFFNNFSINDIDSSGEEQLKTKLISNKNIHNIRTNKLFNSNIFLEKLSKNFLHNHDKTIGEIEHKNKILVEIVETGTGCAGNCSYCVIKKAKKKIISKDINCIINEIKSQCKDSKQLVLIADDCGSYGIDKGYNLPFLLNEIHKVFPDISISLNFFNPMWLQNNEDEYLKIFKNIQIDSIQITMQSGSNSIIKRMNRHYDVDKSISIIKKIKKISPKTLIYSHFIVGFPGEKTSDYLKTLFILIHFDASFPFKYEDRAGAESTTFSDKKSRFIINIRYILFIIFIRFLILLNFLKDYDKQKSLAR